MSISTPIYAWKSQYINGLNLSYGSATTISVAAGSCSNSAAANIITVPDAVTLNAATNGAGGLDTGSLAISTMYAVYAIGSSENYAPGVNDESDATNPYPGTVILSLATNSSPSLPLNYNMYRKIGHVATDGSAEIRDFVQVGSGTDRTIFYDSGISVLSGGSDATYANIGLGIAVPPAELQVMGLATVTPTSPADSVNFIPSGSSATVGYAVLTGDVASVANQANITLPCGLYSDVATIQYKVTGTASLSITGYVDQL